MILAHKMQHRMPNPVRNVRMLLAMYPLFRNPATDLEVAHAA
jgi:hypothetical protein